MRDAEETSKFPILQAASHRLSRTQDLSFVVICSRLSKPKHIPATGATRTIGSKVSLQPSTKFREEMGNGLRLRITRNEDHKPKIRKGNQTMTNRNIQFKPTAGVLIPLLLACFAAVFISAATPATAGNVVPFKATFTGSSTSGPGAPCAVRSDIIGRGHATHLGKFTTVQHHCF